MDQSEIISQAYKSSRTYPELAKSLISIGVLSYTVDVATSTILYRFGDGSNTLHHGNVGGRNIVPVFNREAVIQSVRDSQQGKIDYPQFMERIAAAGVRFYEATLNGNKKRVTYIGSGGEYEELIPIN